MVAAFFKDDSVTRCSPDKQIYPKTLYGEKPKKGEKPQKVTLRFRDCSLRHLYNRFQEIHKLPAFGFDTFRVLVPNWLQKGKRRTDMCGTCVTLRNYLTKHPELYTKTYEQWEAQNFECRTDAERVLFAYESHTKHTLDMTDYAKNTKLNLKPGQIFISQMDYKERISLLACNEEVSNIFYNKKYVSVLNITFFTPGGIKHHINFISDNSNQNAYSVSVCFKRFLTLPWLEDCKELFIHSDNGSAFASQGISLVYSFFVVSDSLFFIFILCYQYFFLSRSEFLAELLLACHLKGITPTQSHSNLYFLLVFVNFRGDCPELLGVPVHPKCDPLDTFDTCQ